MSSWKEFLTNAYRFSTWPWRNTILRQMKQKSTVPVSILFYHRVANEIPNDWSISESEFTDQIDWLSKNFDLVSLDEAQRRIKVGNSRPTVSLTFDDGYADNCNFALPMLVERRIPVTYFVTTYHTAHNKPFSHDVELQQPLPANSIETLRTLVNAGIEIGGHTRTHLDLGSCWDQERLYDEVIAATRELESMLDFPIRYFAFPFGQRINLNPFVFQMLKDHGFAGVCSAYGGVNSIKGDSFHLQRIHGDQNTVRLKNWIGFDPRLQKVKRYDWKVELKKAVLAKKSLEKSQMEETKV